MNTRQGRLLLVTLFCLCLGVALSAATIIFARAESEQIPIQYTWGKVTSLRGDNLTVQSEAGEWEFKLTAETQYKISRVDNNVLDVGLEEITKDNLQVEDIVAVLTQMEQGEATDLAQVVVVLPQAAADNLSPAGIQQALFEPTVADGSVLPCQAQIAGVTGVYTSPQEAVDVANNGDVIKVSGYCAGVFTRHNLTQSVYADKSLAFIGGYDQNFSEPPDPAQHPTILDAMGKGRSLVISRTFQVSLSGIKLKNGNAANLSGDPVIVEDTGGNIYAAEESALRIVNSSVESGRASLGGGLLLSGTVDISGTTFSNNIGVGTGGGIFNFGGPISITNSAFNYNIGVGTGGGIFNISGTIVISGSTFNGNLTNSTGGGIFNSGGTLDITNSTFRGNSGISTGGGVFNDTGPMVIVNSTFRDNYAAGAGGGVFNSVGELTSSSSIFHDNNATGAGGAVYNSEGPVLFSNSTLRGNSAYGTGGGVYNSGGTMTITNSTLNGNHASTGGGLIIDDGSFNTIINSTISRNRAFDGPGGGIYNDSGATLVISNSTIAENSSYIAGGGIYNFDSSAVLSMTNTVLAYHNASGDCGGDFTQATSSGYNLGNDTSCSFFVATNDISGTNPLLGPLQDNGGPTETHLPMTGSPAIDSANPAACPDSDQRGVSRPEDGDGDGSAICDRGSVEVLLEAFYLPIVFSSP